MFLDCKSCTIYDAFPYTYIPLKLCCFVSRMLGFTIVISTSKPFCTDFFYSNCKHYSIIFGNSCFLYFTFSPQFSDPSTNIQTMLLEKEIGTYIKRKHKETLQASYLSDLDKSMYLSW